MFAAAFLLFLSGIVHSAVRTYAADIAAEHHLLLKEEQATLVPAKLSDFEEDCNGRRRLLRGARKLPSRGNVAGNPEICCPKCVPGSEKFEGHSGGHVKKRPIQEVQPSAVKKRNIDGTGWSQSRKALRTPAYLQSPVEDPLRDAGQEETSLPQS